MLRLVSRCRWVQSKTNGTRVAAESRHVKWDRVLPLRRVLTDITVGHLLALRRAALFDHVLPLCGEKTMCCLTASAREVLYNEA